MSKSQTVKTALLDYIRKNIASQKDAEQLLAQYVADNRDYIEWVLDRPLEQKFAYYQVSCMALDKMMLKHLRKISK